MTNFVSVSTSAARYQDISLNPQKLAGQCAKLKCCMNYEVDAYVESQKRLPSKEITLETSDGTFYFFKADILKGIITYSTDKNFLANTITITARRAFEIINMNKKGEKPESLIESTKKNETQKPIDLVEQESLTRFDKRKANNRKKKKKGDNNGNGEGNGNEIRQQQPKENRNQQQSRENRPLQPRENRLSKENRTQQPKEDGNRNREEGGRNNNRNRNNRRSNNNREGNGNNASNGGNNPNNGNKKSVPNEKPKASVSVPDKE